MGIAPPVYGARAVQTHGAADAHSTAQRPLRLLIVTPRFFPLSGGVETHVYEVARRLAAAGVQVTVLTADAGGKLPPSEQIAGVTVQRVRAWPAGRDYYFAPQLFSIIRRGEWDVMHLQSYHTLIAPLAMLAAWRAGLPYVVTFHPGGHTSRLRNRLRGPQQMLLRPLLARARRLIAVANFELDHFRTHLHLPRERFAYIPNGSDIAALQEAAQAGVQERTAQPGPLIASVGRLERYKGHHRILAALPYIRAECPEARLWIAGAGPEAAALAAQAEQLGVAAYVEIRAVPPQERAAFATQLAQAALVVLLSEYETHPVAAIEALALGRSLLVADSSGLAELAQQGLARAISLESSPQQVAAAAVQLLRQPLRPPPLELPTWDECTDQLLALYRGVVGQA